MNDILEQAQVVSFDDTKKAFSGKDDKQLNKTSWLFKLMGNPRLVNIGSKLTLFAIKIGLPIGSVIKATIFKQFCGGENLDESKKVVEELQKSKIGSILDYSVEGEESEEDFTKTKEEIIRIIQLAKNNPAIPYTCLKVTGIAPFALLEKVNSGAKLTEEEQAEFAKAKSRLNDICYNSFVSKVPIYIDAEHSWIQEAIDRMAEEMMRTYNKEKAIVLTTLQMYRWDRLDYLKSLIAIARKEKFLIGIKLVRGAYLEKENKRALEMGYKSPIQTSKENTDIAFDKGITICLENIDIITLCAGTHNEASSMFVINEMKRLKIPNNHPNIYFSQLFGMSDHITYNLADAGYNVTKYLPYGPVKSVIPYLIRRAQENTAIAGQMSRELKLITEEVHRREEQKLLK
ncbi:MAG: proline dehydrogenase [Bacteroidetes bacterium RIFCSPLOWO2_12_FULL_35_15]|nr:MAG: proline dehydrogenase [Bacteroidetes bacterium RIFCSPLOWO2_12_FULL_35_15]